MTAQHTLDQVLRSLTVAAWTLAVFAVVALVTDGAVGDFVGVAIVGGVVFAGVMLAVNRRHPAPPVTHDPFTDMTSSEILNVAHVRVAGVGGLALVAFCALVAWQFALTAAAMAAGLIGGAVLAWMLMRLRRRTT
jgi:hypothetical protein